MGGDETDEMLGIGLPPIAPTQPNLGHGPDVAKPGPVARVQGGAAFRSSLAPKPSLLGRPTFVAAPVGGAPGSGFRVTMPVIQGPLAIPGPVPAPVAPPPFIVAPPGPPPVAPLPPTGGGGGGGGPSSGANPDDTTTPGAAVFPWQPIALGAGAVLALVLVMRAMGGGRRDERPRR